MWYLNALALNLSSTSATARVSKAPFVVLMKNICSIVPGTIRDQSLLQDTVCERGLLFYEYLA